MVARRSAKEITLAVWGLAKHWRQPVDLIWSLSVEDYNVLARQASREIRERQKRRR